MVYLAKVICLAYFTEWKQFAIGSYENWQWKINRVNAKVSVPFISVLYMNVTPDYNFKSVLYSLDEIFSCIIYCDNCINVSLENLVLEKLLIHWSKTDKESIFIAWGLRNVGLLTLSSEDRRERLYVLIVNISGF